VQLFSAAILPRVHACDAGAATIISDNMNIDSASPMKAGFKAVKDAFESTYACLGITCADVGGLIVTGTEYYPGAGPCGTDEATPAPAPVPEPEPAPSPAPDSTSNAPSSGDEGEASGSVHMRSETAVFLWALILSILRHS
jgi:hypothetical protein